MMVTVTHTIQVEEVVEAFEDDAADNVAAAGQEAAAAAAQKASIPEKEPGGVNALLKEGKARLEGLAQQQYQDKVKKKKKNIMMMMMMMMMMMDDLLKPFLTYQAEGGAPPYDSIVKRLDKLEKRQGGEGSKALSVESLEDDNKSLLEM